MSLYVSQRMLREPRLLVPYLRPSGRLKADTTNYLYRKYFTSSAGAYIFSEGSGRTVQNYSKAGSNYNLVYTNESDAYDGLNWVSGKYGIGGGQKYSENVQYGHAWISRNARPSGQIFNRTCHYFGGTTSRSDNWAVVKGTNSSWGYLKLTPTYVRINVANLELTFSVTVPSFCMISVVAWSDTTTTYAKLFMDGIYVSQKSGVKDVQSDDGNLVVGSWEYYSTYPGNTYSNSFGYGPYYLVYDGPNEVWTDNDVIKLHRDPYQFLIPA